MRGIELDDYIVDQGAPPEGASSAVARDVYAALGYDQREYFDALPQGARMLEERLR